MSYAIVSIGGKQYRVQEGERILVDRVGTAEGKTFHPGVLFVGGDGKADLAPKGVTVTARVVGHVLGDKVRIGKHRPKTGYRRHTGFRARLSQIEIEKIGGRQAAAKREPTAKEEPAQAAPKGLPQGYADLTVAQIAEAARGWEHPMVEAALEYEREHANRKGAVHALESALASKSEKEVKE
jgi:large subunit ribosomal protein L21